MRSCLLIVITWLLASCATNQAVPPPTTVENLDLARYQGTWYEIARLPMFFQRNCVQSQAQYSLASDGRVAVTNRCTTADGHWQTVSGHAFAQEPGNNGKLWVVFDNVFSRLFPGLAKGHYWVLYVDPEYRVALVGNPSRQYLWLLSRTPTLSIAVREKLLAYARNQGYDTQSLIWRKADSVVTP